MVANKRGKLKTNNACKTNKRKCYEEIDEGIFDGFCRGML